MCSKPPLPVFGTGNLTSEARVKSVVGYSCQQDFKLSGSTSGLCTLSTNWNLKGLKLESLYGWKHMTQPTCCKYLVYPVIPVRIQNKCSYLQ